MEMRPKDCEKCLLHRSAFIICSVLSVIPIINLLATVASVVLSIIYLVGLYNAGKDINGCANAFVLSIISLVCNIISSLTSFNVLFAMLFSVAAAVLTFMVTYQVCTSVSDVVGSRGHNDIASLGKSTWIVFLIGSILNVVVAIVAVVIPFADVIIVGMSVVSTMVQIHCTAFLCDIPKQEFCAENLQLFWKYGAEKESSGAGIFIRCGNIS